MFPYSSSSTWKMEKVTGSHLFKVADYSLAKGMMGVGKPIRSATFNVAGFNWTLECFLDGQDEHCAGFISLVLRLRLETDAVDVRALLKLSLVDPDRRYPFTSTTTDVFSKQHSSWGNGKFIRRADLEASQFLRDDCFAVHCAVTVVKSPLLEVHGADPVAPTPSDLHRHLADLLASGEGADVTFDVGGETFAAHRWLLAARSPVFRAELFGEMRETRMKRIQLEDMEAAVFKALLHFIYSDTLPSSNTGEPTTKESSSDSMAQHLLVAADRYGLERLRLVCEEKLCRNIGVDTVANTLALAEQHRCGRLKAACLNFIASPGLLAPVMKTDGFEHLSLSCPLVIKELLEKLAKVTGQ